MSTNIPKFKGKYKVGDRFNINSPFVSVPSAQRTGTVVGIIRTIKEDADGKYTVLEESYEAYLDRLSVVSTYPVPSADKNWIKL